MNSPFFIVRPRVQSVISAVHPSAIGVRLGLYWIYLLVGLHVIWHMDQVRLWVNWFLLLPPWLIESALELRRPVKNRWFFSVVRPAFILFPMFCVVLFGGSSVFKTWARSHIPNAFPFLQGLFFQLNPLNSVLVVATVAGIFLFIKGRWLAPLLLGYFVPLLGCAGMIVGTYYYPSSGAIKVSENEGTSANGFDVSFVPRQPYAGEDEMDFNHMRMIQISADGQTIIGATGSVFGPPGGVYLFDVETGVTRNVLTNMSIKRFDMDMKNQRLFVGDYTMSRFFEFPLRLLPRANFAPSRKHVLFSTENGHDAPIDILWLEHLNGLLVLFDETATLAFCDLATNTTTREFELGLSPYNRPGSGGYQLIENHQRREVYFLCYFAKTSLLVFDDRTLELKGDININEDSLASLLPLDGQSAIAFSHLRPRAYLIDLDAKKVIGSYKAEYSVRSIEKFGDFYATLSYTSGYLSVYDRFPFQNTIYRIFVGKQLSHCMTSLGSQLFVMTPKGLLRLKPARSI